MARVAPQRFVKILQARIALNTKVAACQHDARRAFEWFADLYEQAGLMLDDAEAFLKEDGWQLPTTSGWGGTANAYQKLRDWPFTYLRAVATLPPHTDAASDSGKAGFVGILFHDGKREGPVVFGATVTWNRTEKKLDHWLFYSMLGGASEPHGDQYFAECFDRVGTGPVFEARLTAKGRKRFAGVDDARWFELPLASIDSADKLRKAVTVVEGLVLGDEAKVVELTTISDHGG